MHSDDAAALRDHKCQFLLGNGWQLILCRGGGGANLKSGLPFGLTPTTCKQDVRDTEQKDTQALMSSDKKWRYCWLSLVA